MKLLRELLAMGTPLPPELIKIIIGFVGKSRAEQPTQRLTKSIRYNIGTRKGKHKYDFYDH